MDTTMSPGTKSLLYTAIGLTVGFAVLYIAFRVAGSGWSAGEAK